VSPGPYPPAKTVLPGEKPKGESLLSRRDFVRNTVRLAVAGAILPGALSQVLPAIAPSSLAGSGSGPVIRRDPKTNAKIPITVGDLKPQPGNAPFVGEWGFLPAIVYMVKVDILKASAAARHINTAQFAVPHPSDPSYAILVYRGKCKHLGCTVGWNGLFGASKDIEDYNGDGVNEGRILCPCHQGQYDIHNLAKNVPGTPPPAPLDIIRMRVGNFTDPEGKIPAASNAIIGAEVIKQNAYLDGDLDGKAGKTAYALGSQAATGA
jgi:Rieske Fe-S protein